MDTQAMTSGDGYPSFDIQAQRDAIPPMKTNKMNLLSDAFKAELKELINEVLDAVSYTHLTLPTKRIV